MLDSDTRLPDCLLHPKIRLLGEVNEGMVEALISGLAEHEADQGEIAIEITTGGGDAELGRRLVLEIELARRRLAGCRLLFLGKTQVQSAGLTLMSAFPRRDRYLTSDTMLLVHSRQLPVNIELSGPMRSSLPEVIALKEQLELGIRLEEENFRRLIEGSDIHLDEICSRALAGWYMTAEEALKRGLVGGILD